MNGLNDANSAMNNFMSTNNTFKTLQDNISNITGKINNVDRHLPGNISKKVDRAKGAVDYATTKNKTLLDKAQQQNAIKNFFDKGVKNAQKEVMEAQKNLTKLTSEHNKIKNNVLENLNIELDKNIADINKFKTTDKTFKKLDSGLTQAQSAYDKAVRNTRRARTAVVGTAAGVGAGAYGLNKMKQNKDKNQQLQYIDPMTGLNNNIS